METLWGVVFIIWVVCAFLAAVSVPSEQALLAGFLGFLLGPFGILAAILISIRKAIEGVQPVVKVQPRSSRADASKPGEPKRPTLNPDVSIDDIQLADPDPPGFPPQQLPKQLVPLPRQSPVPPPPRRP